ncbi:leucine-rich repeat-containing protein 15-like [Culicoides brevitarsis]|uniref:leucine-rich repeat-containing protein 15-like n=1 Tax=Culicoides brevitarsis TaxID=469753 RepID=UPI00307BB416
MFRKLFLLLFIYAASAEEKVTLDCEYPALSKKLDVCKISNVEGDFSNKEVVLNPRIGSSLTEIKIKHVHLGRIPSSIINDHASIKELKIKNGSIYSLEGVSDLKQLEELELRHNALHEIRDTSFNNPALEEINLEFNLLEVIHPDAFKNTPVLKKVELAHNLIRVLHKSLLVPSIETLNMEGNKLESIEDVFTGNQNIKRLYLTNNQITKITANTFTDCSSLFKLYLDYNQIETIENGAFDHLESLQVLQLQNNKLKTFELNIGSEYMGSLYIGNNDLTKLSVKLAIPGLKRKFTLEAHNNRLTEVDIPREIFFNKIKLRDNPIAHFAFDGIKSADFLYFDNVDLSTSDLSPLLQTQDLITISMNDSGINVEQFKTIVQHPKVQLIDVAHNPKLSELNFSEITNAGKNIEGIILNFCGLKEINVEAVKKAFPNLNYFKVQGTDIGYEEAKRIEKQVSSKSKIEDFA